MNMLILASASSIRARLLREAGINFGVRPAEIDEEAVKASLQADKTGHENLAGRLAEEKALSIARTAPQALVLGCDQVLVCGDRLFGKAHNAAEARATLLALRGKAHSLITACALAQNGKVLWRLQERATLQMRPFSDEFLEVYLRAEGGTILGSVGCYRFEGRGAQLFDHVEGDFFTILGLPLLPLLPVLREYGVLLR
jgi:septum formation protein